MNLKTFLLTSFSFLCLCISTVFSQGILKPEWVLTESSKMDNGNSEAWAIGTDQSGNVLWGVNKDSPGLFEFMDAFVYKLDEFSNLIWLDTAATGLFAQQSYNLKVSDSLIYLGGRTCRTLGIDSCDVLFFTTDLATGSTAWDFVWDGGYGYEEIDGIALGSDGIYITGWSVGNGTKIDALLMKLDYSGNLIWQTTWGSTTERDDHQDGQIVVDDSLIFISGLYNGSSSLGWEGRALLATFDKSDGSFVDSITYGRQDPWLNAENALSMTTDGTYLYTTGYTTTSANNWDIFVAKFDKTLNNIWYTTWGGIEAAESARAITLDNNGSIYVGGTTESFGNGKMDMVLLKINPAGNLEWYNTWGDELDDQILDIHLHNQKLYLTGKTQSFHLAQKWEAILLQVDLDNLTAHSDLVNDSNSNLRFFPNPMTNLAILKLDHPILRPQKFSLFDAMGQEVVTLINIPNQEIKIERKSLGSGIYYFQLTYDDTKHAVGKLLIN